MIILSRCIYYKMILTVDKKKKFLVTMIVIMACATAINYGLYNVLNSYLGKDDNANSIYSAVNLNIIITVTIIAFVTVIMVVLIPNEKVKELMTNIEKSDHGTVLTGTGNLGTSGTDGYEYDEESDAEKLSDMVDEDLEDNKK